MNEPRTQRLIIIIVINLALTLVLLGLVVYLLLRPAEQQKPDPQRYRRMAALFEGRGLYREAAEAYARLLDQAALTPEEEARIRYQRAELLYTRLDDCRTALPEYLAAKELNPGANYLPELDKKSMTCFERLGMSLDAQNLLKKATALKPDKEPEQGAIVAEIDGRKISLSDLEAAIRELPPEMQKELTEPKSKLGFLESYLFEQMLYDQAVRQGLDQDQEFTRRLEKLKRNLLSQQVYHQEVQDKLKVSVDEISKYYLDHQEEFQEGEELQPLEKVADQIREKLARQKETAARAEMIQEMMKIHNVKIYKDALKAE